MKFIRNARFRDRVLDLLSKALLIAISALVCLWMVSGASAGTSQITGVKTQALPDGSYAIDFALSQKLSAEDVQVDFERNFIQLSLRGVSAYPARTENINEAALEKVFTYQYQPDLARARVLLKTSAAAIKDKASWEFTAKGLRILVKGQAVVGTDSLKSKAAANSDIEEDRIVQEILSEVKPAKVVAAAAAVTPALLAPEEQPIFSAKIGNGTVVDDGKGKESAATRVFASLLLVIGLIGAAAVAYRRFALGKSISFLKQPKVIEVVSTQSLGPKRSVALIKVLDQYMVVGMAGDGMNLLANLGADVKIEKYLDQTGTGSSFSDAFENALSGDVPAEKTSGTGAVAQKGASVSLGIRSSIKKRIEGFKPL